MDANHYSIKAGVVGAGYVSAYHVRAMQSLGYVEVVGIADVDEEKAKALASRFQIPGVYRSLSDMAAARPDVIHVCTPPSSHCAITLEALKMGCHVFVEKPMAPTIAECDRMIAEAQAAGRVLSVNHSARMDPIVLEAIRRVRAGEIGDVLAADFFRSSDYPPYAGGPVPAPYRTGAYPFQDLGVHGLYLLESFLGEIRHTDVRYTASGREPNLFFDEWRALVDCRNGSGQMYISWNACPVQNELVIHGTHGVMTVDCLLQTCTVKKALPGPKAIQTIVGAVSVSVRTLLKVCTNTIRFATGKLLSSPGIHVGVREFHEALSRGETPPVPAAEGRRVVYWLESVSVEANRAKETALRVGQPLRPSKVLITGGTGFLGGALLQRLLEGGETVRVMARRPSTRLEADPRISIVYGNLGDPDVVEHAMEGIETVYHVGAMMRGGRGGWDDFQAGTVVGTHNVVEAALRGRVKRMVYISSLSVLDYASHRIGDVVNEDSPIEPHPGDRGFYAQSKVEAERIVLAAFKRGLPAVVLRPGQIFGPGAEAIPPYGTVAIAGRWIVIGSGDLPLPLVYVDHVVDAALAASSREGLDGRIYQLVDPQNVTQREYLNLCTAALGPRVCVKYVAAPVLYAAAIALELLGAVLKRKMPLSRYKLQSIKGIATFDCARARADLGWKPALPVQEALRRTFSPQGGGGNGSPLIDDRSAKG